MKPVTCLLLLTFLSLNLSPLTTVAAQPLKGYVHSTSHGATHTPGKSFHLMLIAHEGLLTPGFAGEIEHQLQTQLQQAGYGELSDDMLRSDVVIVARFGVRADRPSIDDVLEKGVDPDNLLATGDRYLQLEAYNMPDYVAFLRANADAADDVNQQFQSWRTTVESRGDIHEYAEVLPALLRIAADHMGSDMGNVQRFVVSARGIRFDPV